MEIWESLRRLLWLCLLSVIAIFLWGGLIVGITVFLTQLVSPGGTLGGNRLAWLLPAEFFTALVVLSLPVVSRKGAILMTMAAGYSVVVWGRGRMRAGAHWDDFWIPLGVVAIALVGAWTFRLVLLRERARRRSKGLTW